MTVNKNHWYVRLFFWSVGVWGKFTERPYLLGRAEHFTNVCFFVRCTFFDMPLVIFLNIAVPLAALGSVTVWPMWLFGGWEYLTALGVIAIVVTGSALVLFMWVLADYSVKGIIGAWQAASRKLNSNDPGLAGICWSYVKSAKALICPLIKWRENINEL